MPEFTLFYDGNCPLCLAEIRHLERWNTRDRLQLVDIHSTDFVKHYPQFNQAELDARLHGMNAKGEVHTGLDATYLAWRAVGKGYVMAPLRWPVIRWFADGVYRIFAKHRHRISLWLMGKPACAPCAETTTEKPHG